MKVIHKDFHREVKYSLNRFLSILCIVALGVAFFTGVRSSEPDMRLSADYYYDESEFMDIRVLGTLGMTEEDVENIRAVCGVEKAEGAYRTEAFCSTKEREYITLIYSMTDELNHIELTEGRMPEASDECLMDAVMKMDGKDIKLGDVVRLSSGTGEDIKDTLVGEEFKIVGFGTYPEYLSWTRPSAGIGSGKSDAYIFLPKESFVSEVYSVVYASVDNAKELNCYTDDYEDEVDAVKNKIEEIEDVSCGRRYEEVTGEPRKELENKKAELAKAELDTKEINIDELAAAVQLGMLPEETLLEAKEKLQEAEEEIQKAREKIQEAEAELDKVKVPEWYILDRNSIQTFVEYKQDAERIGAIGTVFPIIFFLVAALVSLTTMTRMVEENRTEIGTFKALGYRKAVIAGKYVKYAFYASALGGSLGAAVGSVVLPYVIIKAYAILYSSITVVKTPMNWSIAIMAVVLANLCTVVAAFAACYKELAAVPASLMRPPAPPSGKRVLLERLTFLWKHLNFSKKATIRNLFRFKKRLFMTVIGIGGCTALLLVGFGLRDSIKEIVNNQYRNIWTYDLNLSIEGDTVPLEEKLHDDVMVADYLFGSQRTMDAEANDVTKSVQVFVPETVNGLEEFVVLKDRLTGEHYTMLEEGAAISEKLAKVLSLSIGDTLYIKKSDTQSVEVRVSQIVENYLFHYIYLSADSYREAFGEEAEWNYIYIKTAKISQEEQETLATGLMKEEAVTALTLIKSLEETVQSMMSSLDLVVWVLIASAALLAFIVIYNLNNINIVERRRELATIKVLGFYDGEVAGYIYRENVLLTFFGILFGMGLGVVLHQYVIRTCEIDMIMFGRQIQGASFLFSIALTLIFAAFVNFAMFFKLRRIDMVESLKSVE